MTMIGINLESRRREVFAEGLRPRSPIAGFFAIRFSKEKAKMLGFRAPDKPSDSRIAEVIEQRVD